MYRVFAENVGQQSVCIFDDRLLDQSVKLVDPTLELEDNASGTLEFTVYPENQGYAGDTIQTMSTTIRVYRNSEEIWEGRPLTESKDFYNGRLISCEGAYAYLNDVDQPYAECLGDNGVKLEIIDFVKSVLTAYNNKASSNRQFYVDGTYVNPDYIPKAYNNKGSVESVANLPSSNNEINDLYQIGTSHTYYAWNYKSGTTSTDLGWVDVSDNIHRTLGYSRKTGGESTKATIDALLEEIKGSHVKVVTVNGNRCLYFTVSEIPEDDFVYAGSGTRPAKQKIAYSKNLLDIIRKRDFSEFFTVLLPVGAEISTNNPETIETMCTNVFTDAVERQPDKNQTTIYDAGMDLINDPEVAPFDTTAVLSDINFNGPRRTVWVNMYDGQGYDYYLFTSMTYSAPSQGMNNLLMYHLRDASPTTSIIQNTLTDGYSEVANKVTYTQFRSIKQKKLSQAAGRQSIIEKFSIPETGSYNLGFAVDTDLMWAVQNGSPATDRTVVPDNAGNLSWGTGASQYSLSYPKLYKAPYPRAYYQYTGVKRVPDEDIIWVGTLQDAHNEEDYAATPAQSPYAVYGGDDHDIFYNRDAGGTIELTNVSTRAFKCHYLNRYKPFVDDQGQTIDPSTWGTHGWQDHMDSEHGYLNPTWTFLTGYFGHHVGRVMVEPGKTYYLNTRITNHAYPDVPDGYGKPDPGPGPYIDKDYFDWGGAPAGLITNHIFAYVVVARRVKRLMQTDSPRWVNELVMYKEVSNSVLTTELEMEKITIPEAIMPERKASWDEQDVDQKYHLELWFTCDNCYVNGCSNLTDTPRADGNPTNGYHPSVYVEDPSDNSGDSSSGTDYRQCVTVAPLNPTQPVGYETFPREYMVNKELADKYGVIVKRVDYSEATSPQKLMQYAELEWAANTTDPAFEVTAVDLRDCGVQDVDNLRLHETIEIDTKLHGINGDEATLSQMSLNLNDLTSNTYTLGYEPNKGISAQTS